MRVYAIFDSFKTFKISIPSCIVHSTMSIQINWLIVRVKKKFLCRLFKENIREQDIKKIRDYRAPTIPSFLTTSSEKINNPKAI